MALRFLPFFLLAGCVLPLPQRSGPAPPAPPAPAAPGPVAGLERVLLDLHNRERAAVGAAPLEWDPALARLAAAYGPMLAARGGLAHSPASMRAGQGENLWMGTGRSYGVAAMFEGWAREKRFFRPGVFPNVSTTGTVADVGHYTQIVWPGSRRLGCHVEQAPSFDYLICRYAPAGNVIGARVP